MKLVIDTNILLSALIKDGITRTLLLFGPYEFFYPEIALTELEKYQGLTMQKTGMSSEEYHQVYRNTMKYINLVSTEKSTKHLSEANDRIGMIDPDDVIFLSTALAFEGAVIWSDDKDFQKQKAIRVVTTKELISFVEEERFYQEAQQEKMKELWDNQEDESWEQD